MCKDLTDTEEESEIVNAELEEVSRPTTDDEESSCSCVFLWRCQIQKNVVMIYRCHDREFHSYTVIEDFRHITLPYVNLTAVRTV